MRHSKVIFRILVDPLASLNFTVKKRGCEKFYWFYPKMARKR